jgi:hypothetical protein
MSQQIEKSMVGTGQETNDTEVPPGHDSPRRRSPSPPPGQTAARPSQPPPITSKDRTVMIYTAEFSWKPWEMAEYLHARFPGIYDAIIPSRKRRTRKKRRRNPPRRMDTASVCFLSLCFFPDVLDSPWTVLYGYVLD